VIGKKLIEALGALALLAGDDITLGSLGNMQTTTAGVLIETIGKVRRSIATDHQWLQAPKTWIGFKRRECTDSTIRANASIKRVRRYIGKQHA
jgi:hypothetical protein